MWKWKKNCLVIPARSSIDSRMKLLVCSSEEGAGEEYYLFDSEEIDKFLKIASLRWDPKNTQITVELETVETQGYSTATLPWTEPFMATGQEWKEITEEINLLESCTLPRDTEGETGNSNLWVCGKNVGTIFSGQLKGIPLTPFLGK